MRITVIKMLAAAGLIAAAWMADAQAQAAKAPAEAPANAPASADANKTAAEWRAKYPAAPADARFTAEGWFAPIKPGTPPPTLPAEVTKAFVLPIREEISEKTYDTLVRKVNQARARGAQLVILDMDTWGGQVIAALDITRLIKTQLQDIRTVCYVHDRAISAGAMIAMSCNEIVPTGVGKLGDCAPIAMGGKLEGTEREKIETVLRQEFRESAERDGYNVPMSEAMVTISVEVWLVRDKKTGELQLVDAKEYRSKVDVPPGLATAPANPTATLQLLSVVDGPETLLTMTAKKAVEFGFSRNIVDAPPADPLANILKHYNVTAPPIVLQDTWSEVMVEFLTSTTVAGLLLFIGLLGIYVEFQAPGHVLPGLVGVLCLALLFGSRFLIGMADWWQIAVFIIGVALVAVELFVTPGFGVAGIAGIIMCVVGLLAIMIPHTPGKILPQTDLDWGFFGSGVLSLGIAFVAAIVSMLVLAKYLPSVPLANKLVLPPVVAPAEPTTTDDSAYTRISAGDVGLVERMCRPVGKVRFGDDLLDASSEGDVIEPGERVRVLRREGNRLLVEKVA